MRIKSAHIQKFKRFTDLSIADLEPDTRLVVLVGPNGSGKSSVFEAFNFWMEKARSSIGGQGIHFKESYHVKAGTTGISKWGEMMSQLSVEFHDVSGDPRTDAGAAQKLFYFRSAYRHEPEFSISSLARAGELLVDSKRPTHLISPEQRVSDNYQRIVSTSLVDLYDPEKSSKTAGEITELLLGKVRDAMSRVFSDLKLRGPGNPIEGGTFLFEKGVSLDYLYENLSGGEKAAFDLLLDFVVKVQGFDNTIFCIDEPELHMHTRLQAALLDELLRQLPESCQLWIATHSVGMARRAMELHAANSSDVAFLDFEDQDFDVPIVLKPTSVDRAFWRKVFEVALDDLASLVAPGEIVFCEGSRETGAATRNPSFDATIYRTIFSSSHPNTEFIPLGGVTEVESHAAMIGGIFGQLFSGMTLWTLFDRDDRSSQEIADIQSGGGRVLQRRDIENYLWDDEVIAKLCAAQRQPANEADIIAEKTRLLTDSAAQGAPHDDVKRISGQLYNFTKAELGMTACGNNTRAFLRDTLAPLVTRDMAIFSELETEIFSP